MHERAVRLDGTLEIASRAEGGSRVRASIPAGQPGISQNGKVHDSDLAALTA